MRGKSGEAGAGPTRDSSSIVGEEPDIRLKPLHKDGQIYWRIRPDIVEEHGRRDERFYCWTEEPNGFRQTVIYLENGDSRECSFSVDFLYYITDDELDSEVGISIYHPEGNGEAYEKAILNDIIPKLKYRSTEKLVFGEIYD